MLVFRSIVFTFLLPAVMVGWVPLRFFESRPVWDEGRLTAHEWFAILIALVGFAAYVDCAWRFTRKGRGTVAPWDGPRKLVRRGLYRWVRNPMYISLGLVLLAQVIFLESWRIGIYLICMTCVAQIVVVLHEEPEMSFRFGAMYEDYKRAVPRWLPRRPKPHALEIDATSVER